jgi:electron transfer flavoprotein beta subunit
VKIAVCVKQIQDPEIASSVFKVDEAANAVVPVPGMAPVMSPFDEQALEAALRIKDKIANARVTVVSIGPASAREAIKHGLSMGADEGILLSGDDASGMDSYVTAAMLSRAIRKAGSFDLILAGRQSADLDAGIVGCGVAELLDIPAITFAKDVQTDGRHVTVERVLDSGLEIVQATLPALVTVSNELGPPRKPTLRETMRAARKPVSAWSFMEISEEYIGPRQETVRLYVPLKQRRCVFVAGSTAEEMAANLFQKLHEAKLI